jgi:hypothetical protein
MEARHAGYFWQILKPKVKTVRQANDRSWYTEQLTEAEYEKRFGNEVSTPKEHKAMTTFNVSFTASKTVRQAVEATVEIDEDDIRGQFANELKQAQIEVDGSIASITLEVDLEDMVRDAVASGDYDNVDIIDADLDGDEDFIDIEDIEISS